MIEIRLLADASKRVSHILDTLRENVLIPSDNGTSGEASDSIPAASTFDNRCQMTILEDNPCHQQGLSRFLVKSRQCHQTTHCDRQGHPKHSQNTPNLDRLLARPKTKAGDKPLAEQPPAKIIFDHPQPDLLAQGVALYSVSDPKPGDCAGIRPRRARRIATGRASPRDRERRPLALAGRERAADRLRLPVSRAAHSPGRADGL